MKKLIILSIAILPLIGFSQSTNLEFNQVLLVDISGGATVPTGKVWKVASVLGYHTINYGYPYMSSSYIAVNGNNVTITTQMANNAGGSFAYTPTSLPIWLPEGTVIGAGNGHIHTLSVLEFLVD